MESGRPATRKFPLGLRRMCTVLRRTRYNAPVILHTFNGYHSQLIVWGVSCFDGVVINFIVHGMDKDLKCVGALCHCSARSLATSGEHRSNGGSNLSGAGISYTLSLQRSSLLIWHQHELVILLQKGVFSSRHGDTIRMGKRKWFQADTLLSHTS